MHRTSEARCCAQELLRAAAEMGSVETVTALRERGVSVFEASLKADTALHLAAAQGSLQILKLLIPVYTQHAFGARKNLNAQNANRNVLTTNLSKIFRTNSTVLAPTQSATRTTARMTKHTTLRYTPPHPKHPPPHPHR